MIHSPLKTIAFLAALALLLGAASAQAASSKTIKIDGRDFNVPIPDNFKLENASTEVVAIEHKKNNAYTTVSGRVWRLEGLGGEVIPAAYWPKCREIYEDFFKSKKEEAKPGEKLISYEFFAETPDSFSVAFTLELEGFETFYCVMTPQRIGDRAIMSALVLIGIKAVEKTGPKNVKREALAWRDELLRANE